MVEKTREKPGKWLHWHYYHFGSHSPGHKQSVYQVSEQGSVTFNSNNQFTVIKELTLRFL